MLPYAGIADLLETLTREPGRGSKVALTAEFLEELPPTDLVLAAILLQGLAWSPWEGKELGVGRSMIIRALVSISGSRLVDELQKSDLELGVLTEEVLRHRTQSTIFRSPLELEDVHQALERMAHQSGEHSMYRKEAILRGTLMAATPREGKYIVRTVMGSMQAGLGPRIMARSLAKAFHSKPEDVWRAYSLCPDMGEISLAVRNGTLQQVAMMPGRPIKLMTIPGGMPITPSPPHAYVKAYGGLRVQVHGFRSGPRVFTSRLRDISSSLISMAKDLTFDGRSYILEAELLGYHRGLQPVREVVRLINRGPRSRRSSLRPILVAHDLLYIDGNDVTRNCYEDRRRSLGSLLGDISFAERDGEDGPSISLDVIADPGEVDHWLKCGEEVHFRTLDTPYTPGVVSRFDLVMRGPGIRLNTAVLDFEWSADGSPTRLQLALRDGDELVPVGWTAPGGMGPEIGQVLGSNILGSCSHGEFTRPPLVLQVVAEGLVHDQDGYRLLRPRPDSVRYEASLDDVDPLKEF